MQTKNNEVRAGELEHSNKNRVASKNGEENATVAEDADVDTSKENAASNARPAAGFTRTLIAKTERPSTTTALVQRTENLQLDSDDGVVCALQTAVFCTRLHLGFSGKNCGSCL
jgi:hypothetical protein